jgi:hypothetical protein
MRTIQKAIGASLVMFYGLLLPVLSYAQEANEPAELPGAIERSESDAAGAFTHGVGDFAASAESAFKNEAEKDVSQLNALFPTPSGEQTPTAKVDDSLASIEEDERSLEAQANALGQAK